MSFLDKVAKFLESIIEHLKLHPRAFWFVFWGELAERASFYGMRTLLVKYLLESFHFADAHAASTALRFTGCCYLLCLPGGFIADRLIGKYWTIVGFSIPYIMGHIILGTWVAPPGLYLALTLLACGSGSIKPNTSTLMGMVYDKEGKKELLTEAFSYFYAAINIGAALTSLSLPVVRDHYGYATALMCPTILMGVALFIFAMGKPYYPPEKIDRTPKTPKQRANELATLTRLSGIFLLIALFWFVYDQSSGTWITFANSKMDLWLRPFNVHITADQVQGINPVLIVALTPIFNWMWEYLKMRREREVPATQKMMIGFILVIVCMGVMSLAGYMAQSGPVSVWWMILATLVITMAELCVSVVGLEFAYTQATHDTHSTVTAAFLLTVFIGDYVIGANFTDWLYSSVNEGTFFLIQTVIMAVVAVVFHFVARHFERQELPPEGEFHEASALHPG